METDPSHIFDYWHQLTPFLLTGFNSVIYTNAIAICGLLICSALLSGSEVAFFSLGHLDRIRLSEEAEKIASSARILALLERPRYLLSTILITNNIVNIAIILVSNSLLQQLMPQSIPVWLDFMITIVLVTFLLVLFGEIAPKVYANQNNMKIARMMSQPLNIMSRFLVPISWVLVRSTRVVENRLRNKMNKGIVSQEDIASAIELTVKGNKYAKQDVNMLKGIVRFGNTSAAEIMKPRMKVVALGMDTTFEEVVRIFTEENFSRIPIYEEDLDNIKGIIHAKDLLHHIGGDTNVDWHELIRPALVATEKRKIDDLFHDFQEKRTHMAIVVDEYGGTKGIVTLEDILEEIVGEIQDEFDQPEEARYRKVNEYTYDFDGSVSILEACRVMDLPADFFDENREGAETLAGLILVLHGAIPLKNTPILCKNHHLITLAASKRRIEKIRIVLPIGNNNNNASPVSETPVKQ